MLRPDPLALRIWDAVDYFAGRPAMLARLRRIVERAPISRGDRFELASWIDWETQQLAPGFWQGHLARIKAGAQ